MNAKEKAVQVGRPNTANQGNSATSTVFSVRCGKHIVKVNTQIFCEMLGYMVGGLFFGIGILALCILIPMLGGY